MEPDCSPPASVIANANGYWKVERIVSSPCETSINDDLNSRLMLNSTSSDSGSEEPASKSQPYMNLRSDSSDESEPAPQHVTEPTVTPGCMKEIRDRFRTKRGKHLRGNQRPLNTYLMQRRRRAKLFNRPLGGAAVKKSGHLDGCKPWAVGELVWARPGHPDPLPWWPAIIVQRPYKFSSLAYRDYSALRVRRKPGLINVVPQFRVCLLGPLTSVNFRLLPQTRLRLFAGREEFDSFLRETVMQAEDKPRALRQFVVHPKLQSAWQVARDSAEAARLAKPEASGRMALFPWASEATLRQILRVPSCFRQKRYQPYSSSQDSRVGKRMRYVADRPSLDQNYDSNDESDHTSTDQSRKSKLNERKRAQDNAISLKDVLATFEFEKLRFAQITHRRIFVCASCGKPGEYTSSNGIVRSNTTQSDLILSKAKCGLSDNSIPSVAETIESNFPNVFPCSGECGNYLHPSCAKSVVLVLASKPKTSAHPNGTNQLDNSVSKDEVEVLTSSKERMDECSTQTGYACSLCLSGLRRCYICNLTQSCPQIFSNQTSSVSEVISKIDVTSDNDNKTCSMDEGTPMRMDITNHHSEKRDVVQQDQMIRCSVKLCRRWYHSSCLRQPPFSAVVRDRRAGAFSCPAHACLACAVETPGTMPRPTVRYIRCFLCPAAYHPGDWCLPAGSKEITHNWIICPRHALDGSLFQDIPSPLRIPLPSSTLTTMLQPTNVSWCFICSNGGRIICCETCPASFHEECLKIDEV